MQLLLLVSRHVLRARKPAGVAGPIKARSPLGFRSELVTSLCALSDLAIANSLTEDLEDPCTCKQGDETLHLGYSLADKRLPRFDTHARVLGTVGVGSDRRPTSATFRLQKIQRND